MLFQARKQLNIKLSQYYSIRASLDLLRTILLSLMPLVFFSCNPFGEFNNPVDPKFVSKEWIGDFGSFSGQLVAKNNNLYLLSNDAEFYSLDYENQNWNRLSASPFSSSSSIRVLQNDRFEAIDRVAVYESSDGIIWDNTFVFPEVNASKVIRSDSNFSYAYNSDHLYRYDKATETNEIVFTYSDHNIEDVLVIGSTVFLSVYYMKVFVSTDSGTTWTTDGLFTFPSTPAKLFSDSENNIYVITY